MKTVNSVSGGKTSCYMAILYPSDVNIFACVCIDDPLCAPKDPALLKYCLDKLNGNFIASAEHDKTLKVMMQLEQLLGKEIVWVRGKSFDQVIKEATRLPTRIMRFCTTEMKIRAMFEYLYPRYGMVKANIGLRGDEYERRKKQDKISYFKSAVSCFVDSRYRRLELIPWQEVHMPLEKTYHFQIIKYLSANHPDLDFPDDSNCRWCFHKNKFLIKKNYTETPSHLLWAARQEKQTGYYWHDDNVTYQKTFQMNFTEEIDFSNFTMCNSGHCTD